MKKVFYVLVLAILTGLCAAAWAETEDETALTLAQTASGRGAEYVTELREGWKFGGKDEDAYLEDYDDSRWDEVSLPHTWNAADGADGGNNYERSAFWYRRLLEVDAPLTGKRVYLEFLGANQQTDVYANGLHVKLSGNELYTHSGGYTAFRYDLTDYLREGQNVLAVQVSNAYTEKTAPISGDFNMYGGLYRRVYLVTVDDVHVDLSNYGSSGLFLTTPNVRGLDKPQGFGTLNIKADIVNEGTLERQITVTAHIEGDNAPEDITREFTVPAGGLAAFNENAFVQDPHLWNGVDYSGNKDNTDTGYRYTVTLTVSEGGNVVDAVSDKVGFRYFYVSNTSGFFLNGEPYPLRGVNRHQYKEGKGSALTEADHEEDMALILELGANTVRLSHYPHTDYFYDLCDENGIIVWTEIPLVNDLGSSQSFIDTTKSQLTELIRQQYNRPSVCFWGLENELSNRQRNAYTNTKELLFDLDELAHSEDPSGRYTTQAVNVDAAMDGNNPSVLNSSTAKNGWKSDLIAWNIYPGWYSEHQGTFQQTADEKLAGDSRPMALSEYGWGASTEQHEQYPELGERGLLSGGDWHPEEYQSQMHEEALKYINEHDELWAAYVWAMFDFDVDARNEGDRIAQNDKGLVTNDRLTKKDSFYLYKANWNQREPFVHITSSRYTDREFERDITYVKVYSNCESVELFHNEKSLGNMRSLGNGVFIIYGVDFEYGENIFQAVGTKGDMTCEDSCVWKWPVYHSTLLTSDAYPVDTASRTIAIENGIPLGEVKAHLTGDENATYVVMSGRQELTDDTSSVHWGMTALVTSDNGKNTGEYLFVPNTIIVGERVDASSAEPGNSPERAVDGSTETYWAASSDEFPQSLTIDLGASYHLETLMVDWFAKNSRHYTYTIEVSQDDERYVQAADLSDNRTVGITIDSLHGVTGRYVRINVLSCSYAKGFASINDLWLDGWALSSDTYTVDEDSMRIIVPDVRRLSKETFMSHLQLTGNCSCAIDTDSDYVTQGTRVIVTNGAGSETVYTIMEQSGAQNRERGVGTGVATVKTATVSIAASLSTDGASYSVGDFITYTAVFDTDNWIGETQVKSYTIVSTLPEFLGRAEIVSLTVKEDKETSFPLTGYTMDQGRVVIPWVDSVSDSLYMNGSQIILKYKAQLTSMVSVGDDNTAATAIIPNKDRAGSQPLDIRKERDAVITTYAAALKNTDAERALTGGLFSFEGLTASEIAPGVYTVVSYDAVSDTAGTVMKTNENGKLYILGLKSGIVLKGEQTKAPGGYGALSETIRVPVQVTAEGLYPVSETRYYDEKDNLVSGSASFSSSKEVESNLSILDDGAVEVINTPAVSDISTVIIYGVSLLLVLAVAIYLLHRSKRRRRRHHHHHRQQ